MHHLDGQVTGLPLYNEFLLRVPKRIRIGVIHLPFVANFCVNWFALMISAYFKAYISLKLWNDIHISYVMDIYISEFLVYSNASLFLCYILFSYSIM